MALNFGRPQLSIPGPSVIPDRVLARMHQPSPNIYEGDLIGLTTSLFPDLQEVAQTRHTPVIYIANGHGAWEAALTNTLSRGDTVLILSTGSFANGWGEMAEELGVTIETIDFGANSDADPQIVQDRLAQDKTHTIKAVMTTQTDTASSVQNNIPALRAALDGAAHPALFMVDCIASLGCDRHEMDAWGVDVMVAGCQKGLMTPVGLSFVFFNDKAAEAHKSADLITRYWNWDTRANPDMFYKIFCGTPPTHHLFGLREALDMLVHEEGIKAAWARHERFARSLWAAMDVWAEGGVLHMNVADPAKRSHAVTTIMTAPGQATRLRNWCEEKGGLTLGVGLLPAGSPEWDSVFRIGHMGHLNIPMMMGTLGTIDAGLKAMGIPHGQGALQAASQIISEHDF